MGNVDDRLRCARLLGKQGDIYVWQIATGPDGAADLKPITVFNAHEKYLTRCLLSPDSKYVYIPPSHPLLRNSTPMLDITANSLTTALLQTPSHLLGRHDRQDLVHPRLRFQIGEGFDGASAMGVGCGFQRGFCVSGYWCVDFRLIFID